MNPYTVYVLDVFSCFFLTIINIKVKNKQRFFFFFPVMQHTGSSTSIAVMLVFFVSGMILFWKVITTKTM